MVCAMFMHKHSELTKYEDIVLYEILDEVPGVARGIFKNKIKIPVLWRKNFDFGRKKIRYKKIM